MSRDQESAAGERVFSPLYWEDGALRLLDQTRLPVEETWLRVTTPEEVADAICRLAVRGAPAIGVAAAYGLALGLGAAGPAASGPSGAAGLPEAPGPRDVPGPPAAAEARERFDRTFELLAATRPTAVNLRWALERGRQVFERSQAEGAAPAATAAALLDWAQELHARDIEVNRRLGRHGAALFAGGTRVLTHCNAGALATAGYGTALGVITAAWEEQRVGMVWVDETRPLLQGARLTAWELARLGIPFRLVTDSSAGTLMAQGLVDRIVVGADRIAANGDTANKIGTYTVAVLARRHGIPFYIAAPLSTVDLDTPDGSAIPIERRHAAEVTEVFGTRIAPSDAEAVNFAFDVTPHELITAIITEAGVLHPPFTSSLAAAVRQGA
jgi:methylthioribose-1-phosphate isomerase